MKSLVLSLGVATLLATGCSSPGGARQAAVATDAIASGSPSASVEPSREPSDPLSMEDETDLQERALADGYVTTQEYERAVQATVDCVRSEGFTVEGPARYPDAPVYHTSPGADPRDYLYWAATDIDDDDSFHAVADRCAAEWSSEVEAAWQAQHEPSEEEIRAWLERAWECLRDRGIPMSNPPTEQEAELSMQHGCRPWEDGS